MFFPGSGSNILSLDSVASRCCNQYLRKYPVFIFGINLLVRRFTERKSEANYLNIKKEKGFCTCPVGMQGGKQDMILSNSCIYHGSSFRVVSFLCHPFPHSLTHYHCPLNVKLECIFSRHLEDHGPA